MTSLRRTQAPGRRSVVMLTRDSSESTHRPEHLNKTYVLAKIHELFIYLFIFRSVVTTWSPVKALESYICLFSDQTS